MAKQVNQEFWGEIVKRGCQSVSRAFNVVDVLSDGCRDGLLWLDRQIILDNACRSMFADKAAIHESSFSRDSHIAPKKFLQHVPGNYLRV